jgi:hypothetical protein
LKIVASSKNQEAIPMGIRERRLQVMLSPEEVAAISDFQFQQRIPSQSAAIRELLRLGLTSKKRLGRKGRKKSTDFGVLVSPTSAKLAAKSR